MEEEGVTEEEVKKSRTFAGQGLRAAGARSLWKCIQREVLAPCAAFILQVYGPICCSFD